MLRRFRAAAAAMAIFAVLGACAGARAGDVMHFMMTGDQDALVVGTVIAIDADYMTIEVSAYIGVSDMEAETVEVLLKNKNFGRDVWYDFFTVMPEHFDYGAIPSTQWHNHVISHLAPAVGDHLLVSLNKETSRYTVYHGMYKLDNADPLTAEVLYPEGATVWTRGDAYAVKTFLNSGGKVTRFGFEGTTDANGADMVNVYVDGRMIHAVRATPSPTPMPTLLPAPSPPHTPAPRLTPIVTPSPVPLAPAPTLPAEVSRAAIHPASVFLAAMLPVLAAILTVLLRAASRRSR